MMILHLQNADELRRGVFVVVQLLKFRHDLFHVCFQGRGLVIRNKIFAIIFGGVPGFCPITSKADVAEPLNAGRCLFCAWRRSRIRRRGVVSLLYSFQRRRDGAGERSISRRHFTPSHLNLNSRYQALHASRDSLQSADLRLKTGAAQRPPPPPPWAPRRTTTSPGRTSRAA